MTATFGADFVQRLRAGDAIYAPPGVSLTPAGSAVAGHAVTLAFAKADWRIGPHLSAGASFARGVVGSSLGATTARDFSYGLAQVAYRF